MDGSWKIVERACAIIAALCGAGSLYYTAAAYYRPSASMLTPPPLAAATYRQPASRGAGHVNPAVTSPDLWPAGALAAMSILLLLTSWTMMALRRRQDGVAMPEARILLGAPLPTGKENDGNGPFVRQFSASALGNISTAPLLISELSREDVQSLIDPRAMLYLRIHNPTDRDYSSCKVVLVEIEQDSVTTPLEIPLYCDERHAEFSITRYSSRRLLLMSLHYGPGQAHLSAMSKMHDGQYGYKTLMEKRGQARIELRLIRAHRIVGHVRLDVRMGGGRNLEISLAQGGHSASN